MASNAARSHKGEETVETHFKSTLLSIIINSVGQIYITVSTYITVYFMCLHKYGKHSKIEIKTYVELKINIRFLLRNLFMISVVFVGVGAQ